MSGTFKPNPNSAGRCHRKPRPVHEDSRKVFALRELFFVLQKQCLQLTCSDMIYLFFFFRKAETESGKSESLFKTIIFPKCINTSHTLTVKKDGQSFR